MIARLRRALREARSAPALRPFVRTLDLLWWIHRIRASGLVDRRYYAAQRRARARSVLWTSVHYAARGFRDGLSPNPYFDELFAGAALPDTGRVPALYAYLVGERSTIAVHPWWDSIAHASGTAETPALECVTADPDESLTVTLGERVASVRAGDWRRMAIDACARDDIGVVDSVANVVVRPVRGADATAHLKVAAAADVASSDTAVRLVCTQSVPSTWTTVALAAQVFGDEAPVSASRRPDGEPLARFLDGLAADAAVISSAVVVDERAAIDAEQLRRLLRHGADALVAPVSLEFDGTIAGIASGVVPTQAGPRIGRVLRDHPAEDLAALDGRLVVAPLLSGATFALPGSLVRHARAALPAPGFELEAISAAAHSSGIDVRVDTATVVERSVPPGSGETSQQHPTATQHPLPTSLRPDAAAVETLADISRDAGFELLEWRPATGSYADARVRRVSSAQRWAIKTSAPAGPAGAVWGDTHFAQGLASALRRLGHDAVVDARPAVARSTTYLDDVNVVIRGPVAIAPPATGISIEWIISHPDEITREEVEAFDLAFAVSPGWAERASERWGLPIGPLLECTDADVFFPRDLPRGDDIVFVGTARGIPRPSVVAPIAAGVDVRVYGPDWRGFIPGTSIAAPTIANRDLGARYETARVVLNDHWPAMRREGFMAMRPFDAVAAGGRVISESVPLLDEVFEGAVVTYDTVDQLVEMLRGDVEALFPSRDRLAQISERIRRDHSFDARARVLDAAVRKLTDCGR